MKLNPMTCADYYKLGHMTMDVPGVKQVVSTWTPRHHVHDQAFNERTVNFGHQYVVKAFFKDMFDEFFDGDFAWYEADFRADIEATFNTRYIQPIVDAFKKLHTLGYLPIEVWAVPEGYLIPDGCPSAMIFNTHDDFGWLPQFLEDLWSMHSWLPATSATTAYYRRLAAQRYFPNDGSVRRLCGDFSMRGMTGLEASAISGLGHCLSFDRSATMRANTFAREYYFGDYHTPVAFGTPSLEHSVVEKGVAYFKHQLATGAIYNNPKYSEYVKVAMQDNWEYNLVAEMCFMVYLLTEVQPDGVFTYVADTYDFWGVVGKILPLIKDVIVLRNGKLVIRPDSGDPIKVILGNPDSDNIWEKAGLAWSLVKIFGFEFVCEKDRVITLPAWIGFIYGDAITAERQEAILAGLTRSQTDPFEILTFFVSFTPTIVALGIGAYTYQYATRDTRGFAIKATNCVLDGIGETPIFKQPKTDSSKKSQKGAVLVVGDDESRNTIAYWEDGLTLQEALNHEWQLMNCIFADSKIKYTESIYYIRDRLWEGAF